MIRPLDDDGFARIRHASRDVLQSGLGPISLVVTHQDGDKSFPSCRNDFERYKCPKPCVEHQTFSECQTILGEGFGDQVGSKQAIRILKLFKSKAERVGTTPGFLSQALTPAVAAGWSSATCRTRDSSSASTPARARSRCR